MACSPRGYKGIETFAQLAKSAPDFNWVLVLNGTPAEIAGFKSKHCCENLTVFPAQSDLLPFYQTAHFVLNLSHPDQWVETFGLTLLEGMAHGLPVIGPAVGGPVELIGGLGGANLSVYAPEEVLAQLRTWSESQAVWAAASAQARERAKHFQPRTFASAIYAQFIPLFSSSSSSSIVLQP